MPKTLIVQKPDFNKKVDGDLKLAVAEFFCDTIQGEGINSGHAATFLRLQGCTLQCVWCDTLDVWPHGNEYSFEELFELMEEANLIEKLKFNKQHLILTGGSPLKQQQRLIDFLVCFIDKYGFIPYIEVENETVLQPTPMFSDFVSCWNNSPKLANSGMKRRARYKPEVISDIAAKENSWFKFVVQGQECWEEIKRDYIDIGLIKREQVILMPEGQTQEELQRSRPIAAQIAIEEQVKFCDRLHVTIWNKKTGV